MNASIALNNRQVLVTGAGGFLGAALLPQLLARGHGVRALYRSAVPAGLPAGVEAVQGDLLDPLLCRRLCSGVDAVIHLAGQAHVRSTAAEQRRNTLDSTRQLAQAALAVGLRRFLYISSCKARFPAHSPYAAAKREAEALLLALHASGQLDVVCLRPALVYGPGMRGNLATLLRVLQRPFLPAFPAAALPMGMIGRDDCCRAICAALSCAALSGGVWELHDGQVHTLDSLVRDVRAWLQLPPPRLRLPRFCVQLAAGLGGLAGPLLGPAVGMGTYRALYAEPYVHDAGFGRLTGFQPQDSFRALLPVLMAALKESTA